MALRVLRGEYARNSAEILVYCAFVHFVAYNDRGYIDLRSLLDGVCFAAEEGASQQHMGRGASDAVAVAVVARADVAFFEDETARLGFAYLNFA